MKNTYKELDKQIHERYAEELFKNKEYENLIDYDDEGISDCCDAPIIRGFCSACKEHAVDYNRIKD